MTAPLHGRISRVNGEVYVACDVRSVGIGDVVARSENNVVRDVVIKTPAGSAGGYVFLYFDRGQRKHYFGETVWLKSGKMYEALIDAFGPGGYHAQQ